MIVAHETMPAVSAGITATTLLRLQRARTLLETHLAGCRHCRAGLACGTEGDLSDRVKRLEASRG